MTSGRKDPVLVVLQLSGGNDSLNTIVPYGDPLYADNRPSVRIAEDQVLPIDDYIGFNPAMAPIKTLYDEGKVAIIQGIGYPNPNRSHFRSMDIWHTCEPDKVGTEGWLGRSIREMDPRSENVLTGVNFGRGLPRALAAPGIPWRRWATWRATACWTGIQGEDQRAEALDVFANIYAPMIGRSEVSEYLSQTGTDALRGADILRTAPESYTSTVEYANNSVAQYMRNIAQVTSRASGPGSCILPPRTTASTPMPGRLLSTPSFWKTFLAPSTTFTRTSRSTTPARMLWYCCFPSSGAGFTTTGPEQTMVREAPPSWSATPWRGVCTVNIHP